MKPIIKFIFTGMCLTFLLASCEKTETGNTTSGGSTVVPPLSKPAFLITKVELGAFGNITYEYDNQSRLTKEDPDFGDLTTYTYTGNTMIATETSSGSSTVIIHHLNSAGYIEYSEYADTTTMKSKTYYYYNNSGYLIREEQKLQGNITSARNYVYANGNLTQEWKVNFSSGMPTDSSVAVSYTYGTVAGKVSAWTSWTERKGRSSANEPATETNGSNTTTYTYELDANGCPTKIGGSGAGDVFITWKAAK